MRLFLGVLVGLLWAGAAAAQTGGLGAMTFNYQPVDRSGTITLGSTSQQLAPLNNSRHGCFIQNISSGDLWINDEGNAAAASQPSVWLPPGSVFTCAYTGTSQTVINIFGATTGQAFVGREW